MRKGHATNHRWWGSENRGWCIINPPIKGNEKDQNKSDDAKIGNRLFF
jgi:hypothetical protein